MLFSRHGMVSFRSNFTLTPVFPGRERSTGDWLPTILQPQAGGFPGPACRTRRGSAHVAPPLPKGTGFRWRK
jgi:hypothetical protein